MQNEQPVCILCMQSGGADLRTNPERDALEKIQEYASKRTLFGEIKYANVCERIESLSAEQFPQLAYHSVCYKDLVHTAKLRRAERRFHQSSISGSVVPAKRGRPSSSTPSSNTSDVGRSRRSLECSTIKKCVFHCETPNTGELHRAETISMGEKLLFIKANSPDENVRIALAHVNEPLDCAAFDLFYHRNCLRNQERKIDQIASEIHSYPNRVNQCIADIDILNTIKCSISMGSVITMNDIEKEYKTILVENNIDTCESDHKKYLKKLINDNIDGVEFVKSHRANESERVVSGKLLGVAVTKFSETVDDEKDIKCLSNAASILRREIATMEPWHFNGSLTDFDPPRKLASFIKWLIIGTQSNQIHGKRENTIRGAVSLISQQILNNFKTDRQATYKPDSDANYRNQSETPLSLGMAITIHKQTRSKSLVNALSHVQLGMSYKETVKIEKRIACGVATRMKQTGGFCLPEFVKKDKSLFFAVDNIDFMENTADGQNTLHGTLLVINQEQNTNGTPVNEPLVIPKSTERVDVAIPHHSAPAIVLKSMTYADFDFHSSTECMDGYKASDLTWFLSCYANKSTSDSTFAEASEEAEEMPLAQSGVIGQELGEQPVTEKTHIMPTWAATNSVVLNLRHPEPARKTCSGVIAPLLKYPPTDYSTLYTSLRLAQGISAMVVGPNRRTVITLDLDLYERAVKLQMSTGNNNWLLRIGELHACFASLHAIGKYLEGSGIDSISVELGIYSPATIRQIVTGKWFRRGVEYHITNVLACYELLLEAVSQDKNIDDLCHMCQELCKKLHERDAEVVHIYDKISSTFTESLYEELNKDRGELAQYLQNYMGQVECLLHLIRACRQGDLKMYLAALEEQVKYYFAHDLYKYARLVPLHLAQMDELKKTDPETWRDLENGDVSVMKSGIPFTNLFVDQTLEQKIRELKTMGGITGITQNEEALDRYFLVAPELTRLVNEFQDCYVYEQQQNDKSSKEHYQLTGCMSVRVINNSTKMKAYITEHCGGNPFITNTALMNLSSTMSVPETAKNDILQRDDKGLNRFKEFVSHRLVASTSDTSVWDPIEKMKLKTFSTCHKKSVCKVQTKLVKLREDRQLLARFLVVQQSRSNMVQNLGDTIGNYEFSIIPRSLFSADGLLLLPTDKSSFIKVIEEHQTHNQDVTQPGTHFEPSLQKVCIVDAMAVVQSIKKGPKMATCADFANAFVLAIHKLVDGYSEARIIFDRYIEDSLKAQTRSKRMGDHEPVRLQISDTTNIKLVPLKTLLSHVETKAELTEYLGKALLREFTDKEPGLVVVYGTSAHATKHGLVNPDIIHHTHEEADTLIPLHVIDAVQQSQEIRDIDVHSPDTDVFVFLMDLYSTKPIQGELTFVTGKGKYYRRVSIRDKCLEIGCQKSRGLLGLHSFSGADCGGKFFGVSKKKWITTYLSLEHDDDIIKTFQQFGEDNCDPLINMESIERFVCIVYSSTRSVIKVAKLRWELFRTKNAEGEKLPPTLGALKPHVQRANTLSTIGKGYRQPRPLIPTLSGNGWEITAEGATTPVKCLELPAPQAVIELIKCGCRGQCSGKSNCSCLRNNIPCTPLCKCNDCENSKDYDVSNIEEDVGDNTYESE